MPLFAHRGNRALAAVGIGILLAIITASFTEESPESAIQRGDFPAFYTMAVVAKEGLGNRLYELPLQQEVQARYWHSLQTSMLPVAYPPYLAALLLPLAFFQPPTARAIWILCNTLATLYAVIILSWRIPALRAYRWQMGVVGLSFFPLLAGIIGGQAVGLSLLLLASIVALSKSALRTEQLLLGIVAGLWMFKPHYALAVAWLFLLQRRWVAFGAWAVTCLALWLLGVSISGTNWLAHWLYFARQFSLIDIATNSDQMTGVVPFLYSLQTRSLQGIAPNPDSMLLVSIAVAAIIPLALYLINSTTKRARIADKSLPFLMVAPVLLLCAPAANFYDLSLLLVPLAATLSPAIKRDLQLLAALIMLGGIGVLLREHGVYGNSLALTVIIGAFVSTRLLRLQRLP